LCISREFGYLRAGVDAPVTLWLRALANYISLHNENRPVGAIGMCLTGAFAISLIIEPIVIAAVAAQPSVPFSLPYAKFGLGHGRWMDELNVSNQDIRQAKDRLDRGAAHLFACRFRADRICPAAKLQRLEAEFDCGLETHEYGTTDFRNSSGERPHATFTKEYRLAASASEQHPSMRAFFDLVTFFNRHLWSEQTTPLHDDDAARVLRVHR
jgi:dienelactone hydrolase